MNQRSDIDRLLRHWMDDGPTRMPDRIVDVVADRISVQPQRRSWRLLRRLPVNALVKLAAGVAAALVLALAGYYLLPRIGGVGVQPTPSPTATGTVMALPEGSLTAGRYVLRPFGSAPNLTITADIPAGWNGNPDRGVTGSSDYPYDIAVVFLRADGLHRDPCHWDREGNGRIDQVGDIEVGPSVSDLVHALQANSSYTSTEPSPTTLGGYQGYEMELQIPAELDVAECDGDYVGGSHYYQVFSGPDGDALFQGDGQSMGLVIVDVDGTRVITMTRYSDGAATADRDAARAIVESVEFTP